MAKYSTKSENQLSTCHEDIQKLFRRVIERYDHSILCGSRDKAEQSRVVEEGYSRTPWPKSKHNQIPSSAVDAMPYPFSYDDLNGKNGTGIQLKATIQTALFIGYVLRTAEEMYASGEISSPIRSGVDWDGDWNVVEHNFIDMPHFERSV